jgi:hypothetical protein
MEIIFAFIVIGIIIFLFNVAFPYLIFIGATVIIYQIYLFKYFKSEKFIQIRNSLESYIKNCNALNIHIDYLKQSYVNINKVDYGNGVLIDESEYNLKRKKWNDINQTRYVHNCSAAVCKNAMDQPFKYLCKYFNIDTNEDSLNNFEAVLNDFAAAEQGKQLLSNERNEVIKSIEDKIPRLVNFLSKKRLIKELGFHDVNFNDLYFPIYTFKYVSAGGNSSMKCEIILNIENLDKFVMYINKLVKFKNSIAGQRALMTSKLREKIKERDRYICQICSISVTNERNLLLEIDHIVPLSKGGFTVEENLQTLCWKCNRRKGSKLINV